MVGNIVPTYYRKALRERDQSLSLRQRKFSPPRNLAACRTEGMRLLPHDETDYETGGDSGKD